MVVDVDADDGAPPQIPPPAENGHRDELARPQPRKQNLWRHYVGRLVHQIRVAAAFRDGIIRRVIRTPSPTCSITFPRGSLPSAHAVELWRFAIQRTRQQLRIVSAFRDGLIRRVMRAQSSEGARAPRNLWHKAIRQVVYQLRVAAAFYSLLNRQPKKE